MNLDQALQRWSDACTAEVASKDGKSFAPSGNRRPLVQQLRHCKDAVLEVAECDKVPPGWSALVKVTPAEPKPHEPVDGVPLPLPPRRKPYHLFVG